MKFVILALLVILSLFATGALADLESTVCTTVCKAEHLDWATWQRDAWCNSKCGINSAWDSVKDLFG